MIRVMFREIAARWILVPAAIVVALLATFAIHSIDHVSGDADGVMLGTWGATLVVSVIVGMSLLGEELTNGRLSFYFARPFKPAAIFGGKVAAGVVLALVMQAAVIAFIAFALPELSWRHSDLAERTVMAVVGERILATVGCVILGMAASIAVGSRSRWFVIDLASLATVGVVVTRVILEASNAPNTLVLSLFQVGVLFVAVFALTLATSLALSRGRTDRLRTHATLTTTLWPLIVPAAVICWFSL